MILRDQLLSYLMFSAGVLFIYFFLFAHYVLSTLWLIERSPYS